MATLIATGSLIETTASEIRENDTVILNGCTRHIGRVGSYGGTTICEVFSVEGIRKGEWSLADDRTVMIVRENYLCSVLCATRAGT